MANILAVVLLVVAGLTSHVGDANLHALARADYAHAIRPGGVDGSPFWNVYARMFMYPPAFDFSKGGPGTVKYRLTVLDAAGKTHTFDAPSSQSPLTPVWNDLAPGQAWVYVSAVDKDGGVHGIPDWPRDRFSRSFWRSAPFRPGAYPPAPRSYAEAVAKCGDEIFERPATQHFLKTGKPDPDYKHNCYPAKMHSALIHAMLGYAQRRPDRAADALKLARHAADFLIAISQPKGAPLEYWPPTYADRREAGSFRYGQNMLIYPSAVGTAYLALYDRVKDAKYLDAAKRIADTYVRLQEGDGTWPILLRESDGKVLNANRVQPTGVISFLEKLYRACGEAKYRACGDRAFAWIEAHPLKDWFWEGQFEDAPLVQKYENPSKHPACELALYLLERYPGDAKWLAVARDILRYAEDQFVCWEKPCAANGHGVNTSIGGPDAQQNRYDDWFYPCALEQYVYYVPIDASNAKLIKTYLALYRAEGNPLDLAKAKALGDALVRIQRPTGYIPTEYALVEKRDNPMQGWLNCTAAALSALSELAEADASADGAKPAEGTRYSETWRIGADHYMEDAAFARLTDFLKREQATGRCALFVATGHSPGKLELLKPQIETMGRRCAQLRQLGYAAGPNILCTIGQGKEAVELSAQVPGAQFLVGSEGDTSCCRHCMRDPVWREGYVRPLYEMLAKAKPDFIWIDDDMRLNWNDVPGPGCFCPRCLGLVRQRLGFTGAHKDLAAFFADPKDGLARRRGLLQLNREMLTDLYAYIGKVVRAVDPKIQLGIMCGGYGGLEGNCQQECVKALAPDGAPVLYRPGGGFYRESDGLESLLWKANNIGCETARLPANAVSQSEIELHPKVMLYKSPQIIVSEALAYIAAGASGTAWNFFAPDIDTSAQLMRPVVASRAQAEEMVAAGGKGKALGVWDGRGRDGFAGNRRGGRDGNWLLPDFSAPTVVGSELQQIGIPIAYRESEADVIAPSADTVASWTDAEIRRYLAKSLYLSADAVEALCERGYGADVGFTAGGELAYEVDEEYADHPLNAGFVGRRRTSCATFLKGHARVLRPSAGARVTGYARLYGKRTGEVVSGTFVNRRGGRIYATGFFPYARMMEADSVRHFRAVFDWLAGGALAGRVASYHRAVLFVRGDLVSVLNTCIGDFDDLEILLRGEKWARGMRALDGSGRVLAGVREGAYTRYRLPRVRAWAVAAFAACADGTVPPRTYALKAPSPIYRAAARSHTGIPSIAVSPKNGRLWLTCYCAWRGGECAYNYVPLMTSADGGKTWKDVLVADPDGEGPLRNFDPELFVNAAGKLVWSWTERRCDPKHPLDGCFSDPKTDRLMFVELDAENEPSEPYPLPQYACRGIMMCKPIPLRDGRTLLPVSHWFDEPSACFYATADWRTFDYLGGATLPKERRQFDEHSVVQCADGSLKAWIRTDHEPRESVSTDGGRTWSEPVLSQVGNPNSRLFCTKLKNGHLIMVKHGKMGEHFEQRGWLPRRELRAFVSDDDGKTWKGELVIDERTKGLSYPDGDVAADGSVYLTYDHDRMGAQDILVARITEADVLAGKLVSKESFLKRVATTRGIRTQETASGMEVLPLGAIRPEGWLRTQLELQRDGLTGHAEELYPDIGRSAWLGVKGGNGWERGPYYAKGVVALGLTLGDAALTAKAKKWVDAIIGSQRANGDFGPRNDNWWANMPALCAVRDWGAATGDDRVVPFLLRYFRYQFDRLRERPLMADSFWAAARAGDNMEVALWLERRTGEAWLTALADLLATQSADWTTYYRQGGDGSGQRGFRQHIVNFMQGLKEPALAWSIGHAGAEDGIRSYSAAFDPNGWAMRQHGRVDRMLNGTELLAGREACQGTELCATAERILSCQSVLATSGWFGAGLAEADDLESVAYNTLPATLGDDGRGVRYYQLLNQPRCSVATKLGFENNGEGGAVVPGPDAGFGCCRSNFHFAWPKFVQSMWMKGGFHMGGGLVALAYGPCTVSNELATIVEGGTYPFGDKVTMRFVRTNGKAWPLTLRRPRWCAEKDMVVKLNGKEVSRNRHSQIGRAWAAGDELEITFPAKVTVEKGSGNSIAVRRGALVYALKIDAAVKPLATKPGREGYPAREYEPKSPWNYALVSDGKTLAAEYVAPTDLSGNVFAHGRAPSALKVKAYRTDYAGWGTFRAEGHYNGRAQEPPPSPLADGQHASEAEEITLVPLGSTQIRITLFPWTGK